jgi:PAS domain S-box-containing protein
MRRFSFTQIQIGFAIVALIAVVISPRPEDIPSALDFISLLVAAGLVAVCTRYPLVLMHIEVSLAHAIGLGMLFTYGVTPAAWTMLFGLVVGEALWLIIPSSSVMTNRPARLGHPAAHFVQQLVPLVAAGAIYRWLGGAYPVEVMAGDEAIALSAFALVYFSLYNLWLVWQVTTRPAAQFLRENAGALSIAEFLPLPLMVFAAAEHPVFGASLFMIYGAVLALLSLRLHHTSRYALALAQRADENQRRADDAEKKLETLTRQFTIASAKAEVATRNERGLSRRTRQLDTLIELNHTLATAPEAKFPYDLLIRKLAEATDATVGQIGLLLPTGKNLRFVAGHGLSPERAHLERTTIWLEERGIVGRALRTGLPVRVANVYQDPDYVEVIPGIRSELCAPLVVGDRRVGIIRLLSRQAEAFSADDEAFVAQFAASLALALENAKLQDEVRQRQREQAILLDSGAKLAATLDIRTIYRAVVQKLSEAVSAEAATLCDYEAGAGVLRVVEPRAVRAYTLSEHPVLARAVSERRAVALRADDAEADASDLDLLREETMLTLLITPMVVSNQVVGVVLLFVGQLREFTPSDIHMAQTLANQAAIAIQNARIFHNVAENRDRLAAILDSTREGVLVVDASGIISLVNPPLEEYLGLPAQRLINQHLLTLLDDPKLRLASKLGSTREEIEELLMTLRAGLALSIPKIQFAVHEPRLRYFERSGAPVLDQFAKAIGWVVILRDMTEEKELQQVRDTLANMIVHDLRSPLTSMMSGVTLIRDRLPREQISPLIHQALDVTTRSINKMLSLVNTLLDISRMESGEITLSLSAVNLGEIVEEVVADFMPLANDQGLVLVNDVPGNLPAAQADRDKVTRILTNLVDNALKFSPFGGQVLVRAEYQTNGHVVPRLMCAVFDSGPGIPDEFRDRIFDRFVQIEGRKTRREGTGLGLAFCKLAVEAQGGEIWAENRPEGGSIFYFTLPIQDL